LTKDLNKPFSFSSRPPQPDAEFQLHSVYLSLPGKFRQVADLRGVILSKPGTEQLHDVIFIRSGVSAADSDVESLREGGGAEREDDT
jgi:hypothetical protein